MTTEGKKFNKGNHGLPFFFILFSLFPRLRGLLIKYQGHISNVGEFNGHTHSCLLRAAAFLSSPVIVSNRDLFSVSESGQYSKFPPFCCSSKQTAYRACSEVCLFVFPVSTIEEQIRDLHDIIFFGILNVCLPQHSFPLIIATILSFLFRVHTAFILNLFDLKGSLSLVPAKKGVSFHCTLS